MGGAFASMWKNRVKKNPKTDGPLMDYNLIMITLPAAVSGSLFGVINLFISDYSQPFHFIIRHYDSLYYSVVLSDSKLICEI